jgi:hypothetical protein
MEYYLNENDFQNLFIKIKMMHHIYMHTQYYKVKIDRNIILYNLFNNRNISFYWRYN